MKGIAAQLVLCILSYIFFTTQYVSIDAYLKSPANYTASIENMFKRSTLQSTLFLVDNWRLLFSTVNPSITRIDYSTGVTSSTVEPIKQTHSLTQNLPISDMLLVWRQPKVLHKFRSPSKIMFTFLDNTKMNKLSAINEIQFIKRLMDRDNTSDTQIDSREDARVIRYNQSYYIIYNKFPVNGNKLNAMSYAKLIINRKNRSVHFTSECELDIEHGVGGKKRVQKNWTPFTYKTEEEGA
jgi:hypothetical protein